jgi:hypothetical protein
MTETTAGPTTPGSDPGPRGRVAVAVAAAVDTVRGARRSRGVGIEVATQYRGGRTIGVRLSDDRVEVHIIAERPEVAVVAQDVHDVTRHALDALSDRRCVAVVIDDLDVVSLLLGGSP